VRQRKNYKESNVRDYIFILKLSYNINIVVQAPD
jgi:hypothetical protein